MVRRRALGHFLLQSSMGVLQFRALSWPAHVVMAHLGSPIRLWLIEASPVEVFLQRAFLCSGGRIFEYKAALAAPILDFYLAKSSIIYILGHAMDCSRGQLP
jgi:hypothetical protein